MIGILDFGMCNLRSVWSAVDSLGHDPVFIKDANVDLESLSHLIVPGVGSFSVAMKNIRAQNLEKFVQDFHATGKPILGICLGMQLLASHGDEGGGAKGLALIPGRVRSFDAEKLMVPHIGWNDIKMIRSHPVFSKMKDNIDFYFVHSYYFQTEEPRDVLAETDYGVPFTSVVSHKNVLGFQFHPEKSQTNGLKLLEAFFDWDGRC